MTLFIAHLCGHAKTLRSSSADPTRAAQKNRRGHPTDSAAPGVAARPKARQTAPEAGQ